MDFKRDKIVMINHRMGKIALHSVSNKNSALRVRLLSDSSLETLGRAPGGAWGAGQITPHNRFLVVLREQLTLRQNHDYHYIDADNYSVVNRRFATSKV